LKIYEVGGTVRDALLGLEPQDFDYAIEAHSFTEMERGMRLQGMRISKLFPEFGVIKASFPVSGIVGNFTLCRKEGRYIDHRHPEFIEPTTIEEDLGRRDFTVNAIARDCSTGDYIDPFGGLDDIESRQLRTIGKAGEKFKEDPLRALRAIRFHVTRELDFDPDISRAFHSHQLPELMKSVSVERRREELLQCFAYDSLATMDALGVFFPASLKRAIFTDGLWIKPTLQERKRKRKN